MSGDGTPWKAHTGQALAPHRRPPGSRSQTRGLKPPGPLGRAAVDGRQSWDSSLRDEAEGRPGAHSGVASRAGLGGHPVRVGRGRCPQRERPLTRAPRPVGLLPLGSSAPWGHPLGPGGPVALGGVRPLRYDGDSALAAGPVPAGRTCLERLLRVTLKSVPDTGQGLGVSCGLPLSGGQGLEGHCSVLSLPGRPPLTS